MIRPATLSKQSPTEPIDRTMPATRHAFSKAVLVYLASLLVCELVVQRVRLWYRG
ncbi:MAG: hypothetical protein ACRD2A_12555 [Vicinamibacterales bacterium]